ncbi:MAG: hypothetical protein [Podoviridae sp. ctg2L5]|nr:MAG: hypothetical protein [Podoviridae sp. ctg2L5]
MGELLQERKFKPNKKALKHEWQAFAYKVWSEYSGDKKELPNLVKHFRTYNTKHRNYLNSAYEFCKDYAGPVPKLKLFYWKFWQLYKNK